MLYFVVGTKAQLIKVAPIMVEMDRRDIPYVYVSTGQHKETMDELHANFRIRGPDYYLVPSSEVSSVSGMGLWLLRLSLALVFRHRRLFPSTGNDLVLVHGDTLSTLVGALVAKRNGLRVGHLESGLRSFNLFHPFPEEIVRLLVFRLADVLFCPGAWALNNLDRTEVRGQRVDTQGNTLIDALRLGRAHFHQYGGVPLPIQGNFGVVTIHRYENLFTRSRLERVLRCIEVAAQRSALLFVMHKATEKSLRRHNLYARLENNPAIYVRSRYDYFDFVSILERTDFVISDGGSNQEECSYMGKPVLLLREGTERIEGLGGNCVVSKYDECQVNDFVQNYHEYQKKAETDNLHPSSLIVDHLERYRKSGSVTDGRK